MIGKALAHYRIGAKLGAGGMGEVYRAHDLTLDREVALKVLPAASFGDATARARLIREARSAAALNHPNICTIYEVGEAEGQAYIAMELVEGQSLSARLEEGPLQTGQTLRYGLQLAEALAHAHDRSIVHRDLKCANVMITRDNRVKVLDFGLAKRLSRDEQDEVTRSQATMTTPGALLGTLAYMAPEVLRGLPADARSDIWALGVVLYEMAAGARPFQGQTGFEVSSAILNGRPGELSATVPLQLRAVIEHCLEKEPGQRYPRGGEVRAALEAIQTGTAAPWAGLGYLLARWRWAALGAATVVLLALLATFDMGGLRTRFFGGAPRIQSVAVLPLENLSGDPSQDFFADGMTEELITSLGRLTGLRTVIARASVMRYKGTRKPLSEIAGDLKVDALITGSVARSGGRVRITAHLVDPETEGQLWTQRYERAAGEVLTLQNELTQAVAGEIRLKLAPAEQARLTTARTVNPEAYEAYLKGNFHLFKLTRLEMDTAEKYFQMALEKDPTYGPAYGGIGAVWALRCNMGVMRCTDVVPKWREAAKKAADMDTGFSGMHARAGSPTLKFYADWDWAAAEREYPDEIDRDPNNPVLRVNYGEFLVYVAGRFDEGIAQTRRGLELDPNNSTQKVWFAQALLGAHRCDEAITYLQQVLKEDPSAPMGEGTLTGAYECKQMYNEVLAAAKRRAISAGNKDVLEALEKGYAQGGYRGAMRARAELAVRRSRGAYVAPNGIAGFYAAAGERELALDWLEKAYEDRDMQIVRINHNPRWDSLRDHPRFQALLRKMNFPRQPRQ